MSFSKTFLNLSLIAAVFALVTIALIPVDALAGDDKNKNRKIIATFPVESGGKDSRGQTKSRSENEKDALKKAQDFLANGNCYYSVKSESSCTDCSYMCKCIFSYNTIDHEDVGDGGGPLGPDTGPGPDGKAIAGKVGSYYVYYRVNESGEIKPTGSSFTKGNGDCCTRTVPCPAGQKTKTGKTETEESACETVKDSKGKECTQCSIGETSCADTCKKELDALNAPPAGYDKDKDKDGSKLRREKLGSNPYSCKTQQSTSPRKKTKEECGCLPCLPTTSGGSGGSSGGPTTSSGSSGGPTTSTGSSGGPTTSSGSSGGKPPCTPGPMPTEECPPGKKWKFDENCKWYCDTAGGGGASR